MGMPSKKSDIGLLQTNPSDFSAPLISPSVLIRIW
jgi:hypothetical protein